MTKSQRKINNRNPFHDHPLMQKGGVHEKSNKMQRKKEKQKLKKECCPLSAWVGAFRRQHSTASSNFAGLPGIWQHQ